MGFFEPSPPPFDLEEWKAKPHLARLKPLVHEPDVIVIFSNW